MSGKTAAMRERSLKQLLPIGPRWFVVQCINQQERLAKSHLINQGFEVYLPMRICPHPKARHPITPFFPRYMFARFDPSIDQWLCIAGTVGVHDVLRKAGGLPQAVSDGMIERIRSWEIDGVIHLMADADRRRGPAFRPGDRVTVVEGPFKGVDALVCIANDNDRVLVMLGLVEGRESGLKISLKSGALRGAAPR